VVLLCFTVPDDGLNRTWNLAGLCGLVVDTGHRNAFGTNSVTWRGIVLSYRRLVVSIVDDSLSLFCTTCMKGTHKRVIKTAIWLSVKSETAKSICKTYECTPYFLDHPKLVLFNFLQSAVNKILFWLEQLVGYCIHISSMSLDTGKTCDTEGVELLVANRISENVASHTCRGQVRAQRDGLQVSILNLRHLLNNSWAPQAVLVFVYTYDVLWGRRVSRYINNCFQVSAKTLKVMQKCT
jgi:hypothetical protein